MMGKYLYVLFLLIAATVLRPLPAFAVECVMDDEDSAGRIGKGVWQYPMRNSSPAFERHGLLRKAVYQPAEQTRAAVRHERFLRDQASAQSQRMPVPVKADLSIDGGMVLDTESASDHAMNEVWLESANATPALFRPANPGRFSGAADVAVADGAAWTTDVNGMPRPGGWAMLMAGILGVCAIARRRMDSI